ncbi:hypothetical protein CAEBREN_00597 [Caenorhabditis brenneri]|uniref:Sdz-33 F-box domain-containing protein n=1 Tax=Caenorhabditis brenneri TaxID=135651 RepID=G0NRX9_CAEBE|nr:hypothetical protein CAEBREN_00597 [Caenorhabditis brenneri]
MNFNGKSVSGYVKDPSDLTIYWEKEIDGLIFMLDYLTELFPHMPICDLRIGRSIEDTETVIEWINKRDEPEVERCSLCYSDTARDVSNILDNVNITSVLEIFMKLPEDFKCDLLQNLKLFGCAHAKWISRDQLFQMNYEQIDLRETNFKNRDISDLVNKIMNGDLSAIRFCNIVLVSPRMDEIVSGINYEKVPSQLNCYLRPTKYGRHSFNVYGVYDYERADGKIVSICSGFPDSITRNIMIFVRSKTEPLELLNLN